MTSPRLLVTVISGGRPQRRQRPTEKFLPELANLGDVEYVVREDQAAGYDIPTGVGLNTYPVEWADRYARAHWRHPRAVFTPGGFHGAFTGREWAMHTATERGYDAVLQLDDNIVKIGPLDANRTGGFTTTSSERMFRATSEVLFSTNLMMLGIQLSAVRPRSEPVVRVGFPYSAFWERTGPGRMPYYGPFEDDIMHAMEYGLHGGPHRTAGLVSNFAYNKESKSGTGMRSHYNAERGLELVRRYPRNAILKESRKTAAPNDTARGVRHYLNTRGFTPIRVTDRDRYLAAQDDILTQIATAQDGMTQLAKARIEKRAKKTTTTPSRRRQQTPKQQ